MTRSAGDATSPLAVASIEKDRIGARLTGLDDHLLIVTLGGHQRGTAAADGFLNGPIVSNVCGSVCFVPRDRPVDIELRGSVRQLEVLIGRRTMEAAAAELLGGDPATVELAGFNSLLNPSIVRLAVRAAARMYLHRGDGALLDDALALELCTEIVSGYARTPVPRRANRTPRLVGARLMAVLERIEHGRGEERRLAALARVAGLPPVAFVRAFEAETGSTLQGHLAQQRIDRLRARLDAMAANEPLDLHDLAGRLDYSGPSSLRRACIAALGVTPDGYRRARGLDFPR